MLFLYSFSAVRIGFRHDRVSFNVPYEVLSAFRATNERTPTRTIGWKGIDNDIFNPHSAFAGTAMIRIPFAWSAEGKIIVFQIIRVHHFSSRVKVIIVACHIQDNTILRMPDGFKLHNVAAVGAFHWIPSIGFLKKFSEFFPWQHPESIWIDRGIHWKN